MYGMPVGMRPNLPDISRAEGKCEYVHVMRDGQRASLNHSNEAFGKGVQDQINSLALLNLVLSFDF